MLSPKFGVKETETEDKKTITTADQIDTKMELNETIN